MKFDWIRTITETINTPLRLSNLTLFSRVTLFAPRPSSNVKVYAHPDLTDVPLASAMQALADPCRLTIVRTLWQAEGRPLACNEFPLDVSKATVSHHFEILRASGIIETVSEGNRCLSSLRTKDLAQRFPGLLQLVIREA